VIRAPRKADHHVTCTPFVAFDVAGVQKLAALR
jgi:hypothetical protein